MKRFARWFGLALGLTMLFAAVSYTAWLGIVTRQEQANPSTERVIVLANGTRVPLEPPDLAAVAPTADAGTPLPAATASIATPAPELSATPVPAAPALLPPEQLVIPRIEVDWPVTLADIDHLPEYRGVGWLFGSAFPGTSGNMVLFGHLGGQYATFSRLHELRQGDDVLVRTQAGVHQYRVLSSYETTPNDVAALAPTDAPIVTLITCSGPWIAELQTNERRLIVVAEYIATMP